MESEQGARVILISGGPTDPHVDFTKIFAGKTLPLTLNGEVVGSVEVDTEVTGEGLYGTAKLAHPLTYQ